MKTLKFFIFAFIIFNFLNQLNSTKNNLPTGESDCLVWFYEKLLNSQLPVEEFCNNNISVCDGSGSTIIEIKISVNETQTEIVTPDKFDCLPNLNLISFENVELSSDFFYHSFNPNLQNLFIGKYIGGFYINQTISSKFESLHISSGKLSTDPKKIYKISHFSNIANVFINGFFVQWEIGDFDKVEIRTKSMGICALNYPDFSGLNLPISFSFIFNSLFDLNSISFFSTISNPTLGVTHYSTVPFYYYLNRKIQSLSALGSYTTPANFISMKYTNYSSLSLSIEGDLFNIGSKFPLVDISNSVDLRISGGVFSSLVQPISSLGDSISSVALQNNKMEGNLEIFNGTGLFYDLSRNKIQGSIDESWCNTELNIRNNSMSGEIPSCFACYLSVPVIFERFMDNQFTNLDKNYICKTFAPKVILPTSLITSNKIILTGVDIGFDTQYWLYNDTTHFTNQVVIKIGKEYELTPPESSFEMVSYFSILFLFPGNKSITFPVVEKEPSPTMVEIMGSGEIKVTGTFFSSYYGLIQQNVTVSGIDCVIGQDYSMGQVSFFGFKCTPQKVSGKSSLLTIKTGTLSKQLFIQTPVGFINNKQCPNDCNDRPNTICDLSDGKCKCHKDGSIVDCQHFITSIEPSTIDGGNATFNGYFTEFHNDLAVTIGGLNCPIVLNRSDIIICKSPPGKGIKDVTIYQNYLTYTNKYEYRNYVLSCPLDCSNNGICNTDTGICKCKAGFIGFDCGTTEIEVNSPLTNTTINNGTTVISNQEIQFQIYFKSLLELDFNGNIVNEYQLKDNWVFNYSSNNIDTNNNSNQYIFKQLIQSDKACTITSTIYEINNKQEFSFAGTNFSLDSGSIKLSLSISNYKYQSNLNTLQLQLLSTVDQMNNDKDNECNEKQTKIELINQESTFNYIKISKNNKLLSGRFINKIVSDGIPTFFTTTITKNDVDTPDSILISLNLPHCINDCIIDPDFSVLVEPDFQSKCESSRPKWVIPVAVVVSVVGFAILITTIFLIYKRNTIFKVYAHKLKRLNKN